MKTALQIISLLAGVFGLALLFMGFLAQPNEWIYIMWGAILVAISYGSNYLLNDYQ